MFQITLRIQPRAVNNAERFSVNFNYSISYGKREGTPGAALPSPVAPAYLPNRIS